MNIDLVRVLLLLLLIVSFLGLWAWAWSSKRKAVFHEASMLPLEEDQGQVPQSGIESDSERIEE
jgi:cbb3-type cytochrome oxidase subunit 3